MIRFLAIMVILMMVSLKTNGQKNGVIVDMTTEIPIREVKIYTNNKGITETNWRGEFQINDKFTSVTIVHPNYLTLTMNLYEMTDTIRLIPKYHTLDEVIVYGKSPQPGGWGSISEELKTYPKPSGHDFLSVFYKHRGLKKKEKKKHDEIIKNY